MRKTRTGAESQDFKRRPISAALGPSLVQVRLEVVELCPAVLPLSLEQVFRFRGVRQPLDGAVGHAELSLDRASAMAGGQQRVNGGVLGASTVREPVPGGPWRITVGRFWSQRLLCGRLGGGRAKAGPVAGDAPLGRFAEVAPQMEPVGDLDRGGRPDSGALGEEWSAVAADDLDPWALGQPGRDSARLAIRQQVHRSAVSTSTSTVP